MTENEFPFLTRLRAEFRHAAYGQIGSVAHKRRLTRTLIFVGITALIVMGAIAYLVLTRRVSRWQASASSSR
jgi:hypothetical protein